MTGTYDVKTHGGGEYFQTASYALAMETAMGLSLRQFGRLIRVYDIDGVTLLAEFRSGQAVHYVRGTG